MKCRVCLLISLLDEAHGLPIDYIKTIQAIHALLTREQSTIWGMCCRTVKRFNNEQCSQAVSTLSLWIVEGTFNIVLSPLLRCEAIGVFNRRRVGDSPLIVTGQTMV